MKNFYGFKILCLLSCSSLFSSPLLAQFQLVTFETAEKLQRSSEETKSQFREKVESILEQEEAEKKNLISNINERLFKVKESHDFHKELYQRPVRQKKREYFAFLKNKVKTLKTIEFSTIPKDLNTENLLAFDSEFRKKRDEIHKISKEVVGGALKFKAILSELSLRTFLENTSR